MCSCFLLAAKRARKELRRACDFDVEALRGRGEGLGLVAMEERAHVVGGEVRVTSEPGRGTTVFVRSPAAMAEPAEPLAPTASR
jgi:signal transduction histidine kinase